MRACGIVTIVQEQRFELLGDDGTRRRFTLAHDAPLGWEELTQLAREGCRVAVDHDATAPGRTSATAHAVARAAAGERAALTTMGG